MKCIYCGKETGVVNSRLQKKNNQIWRRRKCLVCVAIFTTTERAVLGPDMALKTKTGVLIPFSRPKLMSSLLLALGGSFKHYEQAESLTDNIIGRLLRKNTGASLDQVELTRLCKSVLKNYDHRAYLRYLAEHG